MANFESDSKKETKASAQGEPQSKTSLSRPPRQGAAENLDRFFNSIDPKPSPAENARRVDEMLEADVRDGKVSE